MTEPPKPSGPAENDVENDIEDAEIVPTPVPFDSSAAASLLPRDPITGAPIPAFDYSDAGVPTLDYVRDRIEKKLGTAQGSTELAEAAVPEEVRKQNEQRTAEERDKLAQQKLEEIRRSLGR